MENIHQYEIGVTFCGEYRKKIVLPFCEKLLEYEEFSKDNIFYDAWHEHVINGVHGDTKLRDIYHDSCNMIVVLLSPNYRTKKWTGNIEWPAIKDLINQGQGEKICLLSIDNVDVNQIDGLYSTQAISKKVDNLTPSDIAEFVYRTWKYKTQRSRVYSASSKNVKKETEFNKRKFLAELKKQDRSLTQYSYSRFASLQNDDISSDMYTKLCELELIYQNVYSKQMQSIRNFNQYDLQSILDNIKDIKDSISYKRISDESYNTVFEYLSCREAEFYFNFGYDDGLPYLETIKYFENTVSIYSSLYSIDLTSPPELYIDCLIEKTCSGTPDVLGKRYAIHVLNSIAESFSKSTHKYERLIENTRSESKTEQYINSAQKSIVQSISLYEGMYNLGSKIGFKWFDEFIFRNYGAAIERKLCIEKKEKYRLDASKDELLKIKELYDLSIRKVVGSDNSNASKESAFYAWGSFYVKVIQNLDFKEMTVEKDGIEFELLQNWTREAVEYMRMATLLYPRKMVHKKRYGISLAYNAWFFYMNNDSKRANNFIDETEDVINSLITVHDNLDTYFEMLNRTFNIVKPIICENETN